MREWETLRWETESEGERTDRKQESIGEIQKKDSEREREERKSRKTKERCRRRNRKGSYLSIKLARTLLFCGC